MSRGRSPSRSRSRDLPSRGRDVKSWREKLDDLYDKGHIMKGDLDSVTLEDIGALREDEAVCVIDRLAETNISTVRDINRFVGGIIRRVQREGPDRGEATIESLPRRIADRVEDLISDVSIFGTKYFRCKKLQLNVLRSFSDNLFCPMFVFFFRVSLTNQRSTIGFCEP